MKEGICDKRTGLLEGDNRNSLICAVREVRVIVHRLKTNLEECAMTCPEYKAADGTCGVDGFKFYTGMQKPCETPGITKDKCPRFAMTS